MPFHPPRKRTPERMRANKLLEVQLQRDELRAFFGRVRYLDPNRQALFAALIRGWEGIAPLERAAQSVLEKDLAIAEGREPPPRAV
jgi:hypothetical protein